MLVISRRTNQGFSIPSLDVHVRLLKANGTVKLGIKAPKDLKVLRDEIESVASHHMPKEADFARLPQALRHEIRNQMQSITVGLHLLREYLDSGNTVDALETIETVLASINVLVKHKAVAAPTSQRLRALLVDDEPNERELLASFVQLHGYEVSVAADGQSAIQQLRSSKPDIVLLDLNLPDMRGETVLAWIREQPQLAQTPVFIVSGSSFEGKNASDAKPQQFFQKPIDPRRLIEAMDRQTCMA